MTYATCLTSFETATKPQSYLDQINSASVPQVGAYYIQMIFIYPKKCICEVTELHQ